MNPPALKSTLSKTLQWLFVASGLIVVLLGSVVTWIYFSLPSEKTIKGCLKTSMFQVDLCPGSSNYVSLKNISPHLQRAVILTEDAAFWDHQGFDFKELQKSVETNLAKGSFARGGSTISQQLAKNMFLSAEKSIFRKIHEALITLRIEKYLTKKEILERYLNVVEFGPDVYGVKAASQYYFKKSPAQLDPLEASFLAFLLPNPKKYSVSFFKRQLTPFARQRIRTILGRLYQTQRISEEEYSLAKANLDIFMGGSAHQATPSGMDLNSPEEEFWNLDSEIEALDHALDRKSGHQHGDRQNNQEMNSEEGILEDPIPIDQELPADLDNVGER